MKNKKLAILLLITSMITFVGCTSTVKPTTTASPSTATSTTSTTASASDYETITATQAKEMMDKNLDFIILDVRTQEEFDSGYIKGALLIPDNEITTKAEDTLTDKSATILVYCRSGRRSALAAKKLSELGYTNVYDFGGINDWTYDIVTK